MVSTHAQQPITGRHRIEGRWLAGAGATFESRNPAHWSEVIGVFPRGTAAEVERAVATARAAFPEWRRTSRIRRAELFDQLAQLVKRDTDALAQLMARECGKVITECRAEVIEGLHMIQYVFGTGRMPMGEVLASEIAEKDAYVRRKPWGVAAVITPWNFPFAVPLWMLGPSLLEGNTAIFKPSEDTPAIGQRLVELFDEAGFPPGVVSLVHGDGETGEALVRHPGVNIVLFTGSYDVGRRIQQLSAEHHDRITACEMGSKSAVIVCADARLDLAVTCAVVSAFKTSGQRCVSAGRILVAEAIFDAFVQRFVAQVKRLRVGEPLDAANFTGPVISPQAVEKIESYNALARTEGADVLLSGGRLGGDLADGCYLAPFVYRIEHRPGIRCIREEVFGPHVALIPFRTEDDAIRIYNDTDYGLSLAIITENYRSMRRFREECDFGMGYVNLPCIGAEVHLPFGGVKKSGNGHPSAAGLIETVTHKVAWTINYGTEVRMAQGLTTTMDEG
ncbi:MAG: aldehyde dehydrogenase family protein [Gemmataceae bacterium]|nr:aldehyde dehydrogenase family protein [Gemmataceae bacterium]MDW8267071.1 aldehyde dehydrogenase family protein [Gemmataceae bacterium]